MITRGQMKDRDQETLSQRLINLADKVVQNVETNRAAGLLLPTEQLYCRNKVVLNGLKGKSSTMECFLKRTWQRARSEISVSLMSLQEYRDLSSLFSDSHVDIGGGSGIHYSVLIQNFIGEIAEAVLDGDTCLENIKAREIESFSNAYFNEPVSFTLHVELKGLLIEADPIEIFQDDLYFVLRQARAEDYEFEGPLSSQLDGYKVPSRLIDSILEIHQLATDSQSLLEAKKKVLALLRLYQVGSIEAINTSAKSDSYHISASWPGGTTIFPANEYSISKMSKEQLVTFWQRIYPILPSDIYDYPTHNDFLAIAYNRYCESLLQRGNPQKSIASAVMGLESLLSENKPEIKYSLQKRTAKLFWALGFNALEVNELVKQTYNIRSNYVHGNRCTNSDLQKTVSKIHTAKNVHDILTYTLDLLRITMLVFLISGINKSNLLDLLDNALIDTDSASELIKLVSTIPFVKKSS
jgi:Apea-like HEPN